MEIAIIAHDGKKPEMVQFLNEQRDILKRNEITLVSTGTTGSKVEKAGFEVKGEKYHISPSKCLYNRLLRRIKTNSHKASLTPDHSH